MTSPRRARRIRTSAQAEAIRWGILDAIHGDGTAVWRGPINYRLWARAYLRTRTRRAGISRTTIVTFSHLSRTLMDHGALAVRGDVVGWAGEFVPVAPPCPECAVGKHQNCDGSSWSPATDQRTACSCTARRVHTMAARRVAADLRFGPGVVPDGALELE